MDHDFQGYGWSMAYMELPIDHGHILERPLVAISRIWIYDDIWPMASTNVALDQTGCSHGNLAPGPSNRFLDTPSHL